MDLQAIISPEIGQALILSPIVIGLVGTVKALGLDSKFAPLASIAFGIGLSLVLGAHPLVGIVAGLSASGLYSGTKSLVTPSENPI